MKLSSSHYLCALAAALPVVCSEATVGKVLRGPNTQTQTGCYTNMTDIYEALKDDSKLNEPKRFVVCPNTVMDIGTLKPGVGIDEGQSPIIPRSNTEFVCGEDGSSKNSCVLQGGDFGMIAVPVFFRQDLKVENVQIRGFTFRGQKQYQAFAAQGGDISFYDCVFEDATPFAPVVFNYDSTLDFGSGDNSGGSMLSVLMKDCTFQNLKQHKEQLGVEPAIVSIKSADHHVRIENCLFLHNEYHDTDLIKPEEKGLAGLIDEGGYAIKAHKAVVQLKNNCFIGNRFYGNGAIILDQTPSPSNEDRFFEGNFVTGEGKDLKCPFGFYSDGTAECTNCKCVQPQRQVHQCGIEWYAGNTMDSVEGSNSEDTPSLVVHKATKLAQETPTEDVQGLKHAEEIVENEAAEVATSEARDLAGDE